LPAGQWNGDNEQHRHNTSEFRPAMAALCKANSSC
jgi:hypothetical protein